MVDRTGERNPADRPIACAPAIAVWLLLTGWSLLRIPIPAVNEPHYLGKARHFWNPEWCPGDLFLDSSNPHLVFYLTLGLLVEWVALPVAAVIGRMIALAIVAAGWQRLTQTLTGRTWLGLAAAVIFLVIQATGNWSGEWLIGGVEAKVPAYGFLFGALGCWLSHQPRRAALLAGLSISFHPLIGLWGVIAAALAGIMHQLRWQRSSPDQTTESAANEAAREKPISWRGWLVSAVILIVAALPGLIPALSTLRSASPEMDRIATQLQVASRLAHHLDPMTFDKTAYRFMGCLILIGVLLERHRGAITQCQRQWHRFIAATLLIAGVGVLVGWGPRPVSEMPAYHFRLWLLKFYPFRLADLMVPVAVAIATAQYIAQCPLKWKLPFYGLCGLLACLIPFPDENPSRLSPSLHKQWVTTCTWLRENTEPDALIQALDASWGVRWYSHRPEYVNYKDVPQDAASLVEWNERLWVIARWRIAAMADGQVDAGELSRLHEQTGINYLLCQRFGPINTEPVMQTAAFRVYRLDGISR